MDFISWIIIAALLIVVELLTPGAFFFACLGLGALIAGLSVLLLPVWSSWIFFVVISVISLYAIRPMARKLFQTSTKKSNVDALVGQKAWVTETITPPNLGMVKVEGEIWRGEAHEPISKDTWVEVVAVQGTRLEVKKIQ
ncbi:MAG: NfeD family protein [Endomicrobiales bacterium]|jgi:membrane protein implicated in regulation of membrane protease activity